MAGAVITAGVYVLSAHQPVQAQRAAAISCTTDEECQAYCEWKYPGQEVLGVCPSPNSACRCYL
ncbi:MAG TPA: hypothetical protein VFJ16_31320 [Longimicrobium sp.]|nr:hypothetical protein [Longimicrobium sp.]